MELYRYASVSTLEIKTDWQYIFVETKRDIWIRDDTSNVCFMDEINVHSVENSNNEDENKHILDGIC